MLFAQLIEHDTARGLGTDVLIGAHNILRLVTADNRLFAMRIVDPLHTLLQYGHRKSGLALGSRIRITPIQHG